MQTQTVPAPLSKLDDVLGRIDELDKKIARTNVKIHAEGRSFALLAEQRNLLNQWNLVLSEYAEIKTGKQSS